MNDLTRVERPTLLTVGIILMAAKSAMMLLFTGIAAVAVPFIFGIGALESHGDEFIPILFVGGLAEFIVFILLMLQFIGLLACYKSWQGSRGWTILLMVLSGLSLIDANIFGVVIGAVTIIGGVQALERSRMVPAASAA